MSWNLNHRTTMKVIPPTATDVIGRLGADLVVLNEYTDGEAREPFKGSLRNIGYGSILISHKIGRSNQVLIASKAELEFGETIAPAFDDSSQTNFLHAVLPSNGLNIVGLRCPAYKLRRDLNAYWNQLRPIIDASVQNPAVFIGDFNGDPDGGKSAAGTQLAELRENGWHVPSPEGEWSYISHDGSKRSRLDHVAASPGVRVEHANYVTKIDEIVLAGPSESNPISDHAALLVDVAIA